MSVGYGFLKEKLGLSAFPPKRPAKVMPVQKVTRLDNQLAIPGQVAPASDDPVDHLLFALKHEDLNLAILMEAMRKIPGNDVLAAVRGTPGGRYTRPLAYFWEKANDQVLEGAPDATGAVCRVFDDERFITMDGEVSARWRVQWNGLGTLAWCPAVERTPAIEQAMQSQLIDRLNTFTLTLDDALRHRALSWAYLSETRSSFAIEHETPNDEKERAFVALLHSAHNRAEVDEDYLVTLQNATVTGPWSKEHAFRHEQNWLESAGIGNRPMVTYVPPPPDALRELMQPMMAFANEAPTKIDPIVAGSIASFGFVFLHPFKDGNGRLSRFLVHQALCRSNALGDGLILPVSMAMKKNESDYLKALTAFSGPARDRWRAEWLGDNRFNFNYLGSPRMELYRYWDATPAVEFCYRMAEEALEVGLRQNVEYLENYDAIKRGFEAKMDLPAPMLATLIRSAIENNGRISNNRRRQYTNSDGVTEEVYQLIESLTRDAMDLPEPDREDPGQDPDRDLSIG